MPAPSRPYFTDGAPTMDTITILISTYNGGRFLAEQLESIYSQRGLEKNRVQIVCRDDGSSDNTKEILRKWKDKLSITLIEGKNVGARDSFHILLNSAPESDYYAFCDQDDVWYEDKLSRAIEAIKKPKTLYFSNIEYIDSEGHSLGRNLLSSEFNLSLKRVLMCNPANGCAMVWDKKLHEVFIKVPYDTFTMHDEFACTLALLFGNIIYDREPSMGYRLHNYNVTQSKDLAKKYKLWKSIWFGRKQYSLDKRAAMLLNYDLKDEDKQLLYRLSQYKKGVNRFKLVWTYACEDYGIQRSFRLRMLIGLL